MRVLAKIATGVALALAVTSSASAFPDGPVAVIVPFGAGGGADVVVRAMQRPMEEALGTKIIVRNVTGAGGTIGAAEVARAEANGQTIGFLPVGPVATQPHLRDVPYSKESWKPICRVTNGPLVLLTRPDGPLKTVEDIVTAAGERTLLYGSSGPGSVPHIAMVAIADALGVKMTHVPHQDEAQEVKSTLGGTVDFYTGSTASIDRNGLHPIAFLSSERLAAFPDVPTFSELGYDVDISLWYGMFAPKDTPDEVVARLADACRTAVVESPSFTEFAEKSKTDLGYQDQKEFGEFFESAYELNGKLLEAAGMKK